MSLITIFWTAFVVGLSGAMAPGPVLTAVIAETLKRGFRAGPLIVLGHALLEILVVAAAVAGLGAWLARPLWQAGLGILGGLMLLAMGLATVRSARRAAEAAALGLHGPAPAAYTWRGPVAAGFLLSLSNPYWLLWWVTIGLFYVSQAWDRHVIGLAVFYAGHIGSDLAWYTLVSALVASGRRTIPTAVYRWTLTACGVALAGLGLKFGITGIFDGLAAW
jgi:threonine/homoserine/homoserine lactone efflux protein